jgi:precorrin-6Y C5,15-methyltransferase (decarboxylating)
MRQVHVVGMGMSAGDLTAAQLEVIRSAEILVGGRRHLAQFPDMPADNHVIEGRLAGTIEFIKAHRNHRRIVVLASGDPLFYGIGGRLIRELGCDHVTVLPNTSSIAAAFAKINEPWGGAAVVSLHARDRRFEVLAALKSAAMAAVLTDHRHTPKWLARWLNTRGVDHVKMAVFENLGSDQESFDWYSLAQAAEKSFARPNVVILKRNGEDGGASGLTLGMADEAFQRSGGMITKSEVRAVVLAKLRLRPGLTLWDLGAGSGSVGIEASILLGAGRIIAVEQNSGRVDHIRRNARRYGVYNHETIQARMPLGLDALPPPDRIFIGGGGRDLPAIVRAAGRRLKPGGVMVVNVALLDNLSLTLAAMEALDLTTEAVQIQVSRSRKMPWSRRLEACNLVWVVSGESVGRCTR